MAGSVFNTRGVSNTGDSVILGPTNSARLAERERNRNINLDVQDMRSQAAMKAKATAQAEKEANDLLKLDVADTGRFQNPYNTKFIEPHLKEVGDLYRSGQLRNSKATVFEKAGKIKGVGQSLANANKAVEDYLTQTEGTYPKAYDRAVLDQLITKKSIEKIEKDGQLGADDIQSIGEAARQEYHALNRPGIYGAFKEGTKGKSRKMSFTDDPTGLFQSSQTVEVSPYHDITPIKNKKGRVTGYDTRFAGERVYRDQMTDPRTAQLYKVQKQERLKDPATLATYTANLASAAQITDPATRQDAIDELEYKYFIEPEMGSPESWAMTNLDEKQIKKFVQARSLTDKEREIRQAAKTAFQEAENRIGPDGRTKSKQNSFAGTFTKEDAAGIVVGSPYIMVMVDGKLEKVPNPGIKQGVGQTYRVTSENIIRGGGLMVMKPGSNKAEPLYGSFFQGEKGIKADPKVFYRNGFMEGGTFDKDQMDKAIEVVKKKGYTPVVMGPNGKYVPVNAGTDFVALGRVKPEPFMELDISELQAKEDEATPVVNTEGNPVGQALSIFFKGPGRSGKIYTPLTQAGTAKAAAMKYNPAFMQTVEELNARQRALNFDQYMGSEPSKPKPTSTTPKPRTPF
jgi:hypothetical protein